MGLDGPLGCLSKLKNNDKIAGNSYASYSNGPAGRLCLRWMAGSARFGAGFDWGQSRLLFRTVTRRSSRGFMQGSWVTRFKRGMEEGCSHIHSPGRGARWLYSGSSINPVGLKKIGLNVTSCRSEEHALRLGISARGRRVSGGFIRDWYGRQFLGLGIPCGVQ